jgi:hypothetical protein
VLFDGGVWSIDWRVGPTPSRDVTAYQSTTLQFRGYEKTTEQRIPGGVRILTEVEKAWLAGVIDGEGSILVAKIAPKKGHYRRGFYYRANLEIANSSPLFVRRVLKLIGKGNASLTKEKHPEWKDKWQYQGSSLILKELLPQILPYLVVKKKVAEKMLEYLEFVDANPIDGRMKVPEGFDEKRDVLYDEIKLLNERGPNSSRDDSTSTVPPSLMAGRGRGKRATHIHTLSETERAWLAAIIDGEGTIMIAKRNDPKFRRGFYYCPILEISNTNRALLDKVWEMIGEGGVYRDGRNNPHWKKKWMYSASSGVMRAILPQILPYLIVKLEQAKTALEYLRYIESNPIKGRRKAPPEYYEKLDAIFIAMKRLNQKGKPAGVL